ncbi:hypothetical protein [Chroococcus sp. FPU101]|uniref:hypothetical protein n=1 Tax=Chroococcus sp. FPU101 TaxID=1974212 RepID=UPI001A8CD22E|nr:hypothetical protein [Chroococcus sp. FPU101]GFE71359.1 hypothetical protein CFPU101_39690 [Chroococcus sp. FPU101]
MSNQPQIPDKATIDRHVATMRELIKRMDKHIADLDYINARLEEDFNNSVYGQYCKRREERLAAQKQATLE